MLTRNDLQRLELYAQQAGMNYPGMLYRMGVRLMNQNSLDLARIAFNYVLGDYGLGNALITASGRVYAETYCRLGDMFLTEENYILSSAYARHAVHCYRYIANHSEIGERR